MSRQIWFRLFWSVGLPLKNWATILRQPAPPLALASWMAALAHACCVSGVATPNSELAAGPAMFTRMTAILTWLPLTPVDLPAGQLLLCAVPPLVPWPVPPVVPVPLPPVVEPPFVAGPAAPLVPVPPGV